jgi:catechol 2,3-dioxygenase-like lactoylglutathione lyase family enzyme
VNIAPSAVQVLVDDHDAAPGFDRDALGLRVRSDAVRDGFRRVSLVPDRQPEIRIVLGQPHEGRSQEDGDTLAALRANGELLPIHLRSDDVNSIFERIAIAPDIDVLQEPISHPLGTRDIAVLDPAGNVVCIEQG